MSISSTRVTICGGGNGAHVFAGVVSSGDNNIVTVLDVYKDETERWNEEMKTSGFRVRFPDKMDIFQNPDGISFTVTKDVSVISEADVIFFCLPAYGHKTYSDIITPYLQDSCFVVGMPGQPDFECQRHHYLSSHRKRCLIMSLETLSRACRISKYGTEVIVQGTKESVMASLLSRGNSNVNKAAVVGRIQSLLGGKPVMKLASHFLELTMHTRESIHPPIMYSKWRNWDGKSLSSPPLFHQGIDIEAAKYLSAVSDESLAIAREVSKRYPKIDVSQIGTLYQWLLSHYTNQIQDKSSLLTAIKTSLSYDVASESVITSCIKFGNPLVD